MTCIVGVIDKKTEKVFIGADSAGVSGLDVTVRRDTKVFKVGDFVIGCTSSFRMIQLLRFSLVLPDFKEGQDVYNYMCTDFINAVRACFKAGGFLETNSGVESGGVFLVGYKNRLFLIGSDYQVGESFDEYESVGCGSDYAKGALAAMPSNLTTENKILKALEIATHFSGGVRPPFNLETT